MEHRFFLEGDKFIGKSTLLKQALVQADCPLAGFYVERIWNKKALLGFELRDAMDLGKGKKIEEDHCFLKFTPDGPVKNLAVFEKFGKNLLEKAQKSEQKMILLDEIGGIELLVPEFSSTLFSLLQQSIPIVGVFKSDKNYQQQRKQTSLSLEIDGQRKQLRKLLGDISEVKKENKKEIRYQLDQFVRTAF